MYSEYALRTQQGLPLDFGFVHLPKEQVLVNHRTWPLDIFVGNVKVSRLTGSDRGDLQEALANSLALLCGVDPLHVADLGGQPQSVTLAEAGQPARAWARQLKSVCRPLSEAGTLITGLVTLPRSTGYLLEQEANSSRFRQKIQDTVAQSLGPASPARLGLGPVGVPCAAVATLALEGSAGLPAPGAAGGWAPGAWGWLLAALGGFMALAVLCLVWFSEHWRRKSLGGRYAQAACAGGH